MPPITTTCQECRKPFESWPSQKRLYCSTACRAQAQSRHQRLHPRFVPTKPRRGDTIACATCGNAFYRSPEHIRRLRLYCSSPCWNIAQTKTPVVKTCAQCGKELRLKPSQALRKYCSKECWDVLRMRRGIGRMHNGKQARLNKQAYVLVWQPDHPKNGFGWVLEHRLVVEGIIGRPLLTVEQVDHINGDRSDNRPENLQVIAPGAHGTKTARGMWDLVTKDRTELAEYRRIYGPLTK